MSEVAPIVSLAAVAWDFPLVGRTRMLCEAWNRAERSIAFVEPPYVRTAAARLRHGGRLVSDVGERTHIVRPWPALPRRLWNRIGRRGVEKSLQHVGREVRRGLERFGRLEEMTALVVSPVWAAALRELPFRRVLYDCIDLLRVQVPRPALGPMFEEWERELLARADKAIATARSLADGLLAMRPDLPIRLIRNGVDFERFAATADTAPPADLPTAARPIVGYVGVLESGGAYEWIDWDLVERTIVALPEFDFVFVGPYPAGGRAAELAKHANVRLLGGKPHTDVPRYIARFDVCWVPFAENDVVRACNPVKIYEYFALGKPVISTPVADLAQLGGLATVVRGAGAAVGAIRAAIGTDDPRARDARRAIAKENSWAARAAEIEKFASG